MKRNTFQVENPTENLVINTPFPGYFHVTQRFHIELDKLSLIETKVWRQIRYWYKFDQEHIYFERSKQTDQNIGAGLDEDPVVYRILRDFIIDIENHIRNS